MTVQDRLPGRPLFAPGAVLDEPVLDALLRLVELQADAGVPAGEHDFTGYVANVLFDGWTTCGPTRPGLARRPVSCARGCGAGCSRSGDCGCPRPTTPTTT